MSSCSSLSAPLPFSFNTSLGGGGGPKKKKTPAAEEKKTLIKENLSLLTADSPFIARPKTKKTITSYTLSSTKPNFDPETCFTCPFFLSAAFFFFLFPPRGDKREGRFGRRRRFRKKTVFQNLSFSLEATVFCARGCVRIFLSFSIFISLSSSSSSPGRDCIRASRALPLCRFALFLLEK